MKKEIERIAQHNDMSVEFVTWFFNEKKSACGEHWFLVLGAMWEGWKGRSIEMDRLAAENVALEAGIGEAYDEMEQLDDGYFSTDADGEPMDTLITLVDAQAAIQRLAIDIETPATDRIVAEAEARGVEKFAAKLRIPGDDQFFDAVAEGVAGAADAFAKQLREGADKC